MTSYVIFPFMNDRKLFSGLYDADLYGFGSTQYYVDMHIVAALNGWIETQLKSFISFCEIGIAFP